MGCEVSTTGPVAHECSEQHYSLGNSQNTHQQIKDKQTVANPYMECNATIQRDRVLTHTTVRINSEAR